MSRIATVSDRWSLSTREDLRYAIVSWSEHTYNRRRCQCGLGKLTPVEFELAFAPNNISAQAA
ncbi:MAG: hypothetical protein LH645_11675 [Actinomycetia bacterium]|nr:hypothetical protein [Actinomycetes bacterium]